MQTIEARTEAALRRGVDGERTEDTGAAGYHPVRSRVNAWFFRSLDGYMHRKYGALKRELFGGLSRTVVEIGAGTGANFRYLDPGTHVIAIEPNVHMHRYLREAAARWRVTVDVRAAVAERLPLADASADAVISTLVLCTVSDPARVLQEIRRVLKPGGRFWCIEHVAAPERTFVRAIQRAMFRPWRWFFEGCHDHRPTGRLLGEAGFSSLEVTPFTFHSVFVPVRPQIAAVGLKANPRLM